MRFSVIIPAYQAENTINRAVDSALNQTYSAFEILVCNDGSTDRTGQHLDGYGDSIIVVQQENRGLSAARNACLKRATGDWIVLLDADDEFLPHRLERIKKAIEESPSVSIVTTDAFVRSTGEPDCRYYDDHKWPEGEQGPAIVRSCFLFVASAVRADELRTVGGFRTDLPHDSEYPTWVRMILSGAKAAFVNEPLAVHHVGHAGQLSSNRIGTYSMVLSVLDEVQGAFGPSVDRACEDRRSETERLLAIARATAAVRNGQRIQVIRAVFGSRMPIGSRCKFALAAIAPNAARRRLDGVRSARFAA